MTGCLKSTLMLLQADSNKLSERVDNVTLISFTRELAASMKKEYALVRHRRHA
jgi:hypothetical protein